MKRIILLVIITVIALLTVGCEKEEVQALRIGVMPAVDTAPIFLAEKNGYFEELGLEVEIQVFNNAQNRQTALQTNEIDGAMTDLVALITNNAAGFDLRAVLALVATFFTADLAFETIVAFFLAAGLALALVAVFFFGAGLVFAFTTAFFLAAGLAFALVTAFFTVGFALAFTTAFFLIIGFAFALGAAFFVFLVLAFFAVAIRIASSYLSNVTVIGKD